MYTVRKWHKHPGGQILLVKVEKPLNVYGSRITKSETEIKEWI